MTADGTGAPGAWTLVVLSGGQGRRLGGVDKAALRLGTDTLLETLVQSVPTSMKVVVAGPPAAVGRQVTFVQESPAGGGPVAGTEAALRIVDSPFVAVVAVDMPWVVALLPELMSRLEAIATSSPDVDVLVPVSTDGIRQLLACAWRSDGLRAALGRLGTSRDRSVRELVAAATAHEWTLDAGQTELVADIDTDEDLESARRRTAGPRL
jgi:molybdopterin-guanine dinucleotide biosynthesis protein A